MGVSTNAILAFGIDLGEEQPWPDDDDDKYEDWEGYLCFLAGLAYDNSTWPEMEKVIKASPVTMETHCSYDYPMYFAAVTSTVKIARRGYPNLFASLPPVEPKQIELFRQFLLERCGITVDYAKLGWHLFSLWD